MQRQPGKCAVVLRADELASYGFNAATQVTLDARIVTQAAVRLRNLSGAADHHNFVLQYGGHSRHDLGKEIAYKLRFPRIYGRPWHSQLTLQQSNNDCRRESSYNEVLRGANFDLLSYALLCEPVKSASTTPSCLAPDSLLRGASKSHVPVH